MLTKKKFERESKEIGVTYAREVDQRGADQSIKVPNVSALEFAKRFMAYSIRLHFTLVLCPFGFSVLSLLFWSFHFPVFGTASQFAVFVQVTRWIFSYKVYSRQGLPASKRWKRHYLLMFSLTGFTIEVLVSIIHNLVFSNSKSMERIRATALIDHSPCHFSRPSSHHFPSPIIIRGHLRDRLSWSGHNRRRRHCSSRGRTSSNNGNTRLSSRNFRTVLALEGLDF